MTDWIQTYLPNVYKIGLFGDKGWLAAIYTTLYMTVWAFIFGGAIGLLTGLFLVLTAPGGVLENKYVFHILDKMTSVFRAIPFIILLFILQPLTYLIVKTSLGPTAAIVPLAFATFAFFTRQVQVVMSEMDRGVIEAAQASGATTFDLIKVYLSEGLPDLIRVSTVTLISLVGETAMAGAIGSGGIGNIAKSYGFDRFNHDVTWVATGIIILIIFTIQLIGDYLTRKISHR
ncbi:methionine ABC transporter permease [Streptococcus cameli]